ncbi:molybdopterin converting factor subunit 1 [Simiduia aestuariiviva]|uniref:Molybdopterin synthase sulfur carrier subunit n=1 Tax=Simiduia aestuariiviva TaxID=1510459 RepID=A0A839UPV4_9GAMM|nr:molybdopterin converting factor subunit 1 [Simiduia aestuariiviva]MBB3167836.1 molybdopterin synthase sulfur carrier subunit [Simiduia aestuariiviva]
MINVKFFARLRDLLDTDSVDLNSESLHTAKDVIDQLIKDYPHWQDALSSTQWLVAINQTMAQPNSPVADGDEVAFFPPVTGG